MSDDKSYDYWKGYIAGIDFCTEKFKELVEIHSLSKETIEILEKITNQISELHKSD